MPKVTVIAQSVKLSLQVFILENSNVYFFAAITSDYMKRAKLLEKGTIYTPLGAGKEFQQLWPSDDWELLYCENLRIKYHKKDVPIDEYKAINQNNTGIYNKYIVYRVDKRDQIGGDRQNAEYFVLDITYDKFAKKALSAYASACRDEYPKLANDIIKKLWD